MPVARILVNVGGLSKEMPLEATDTCSIGRNGDNTLHLPSASVSRRHAVVQPVERGFCLCDLGSSNGTFLNGQRVKMPVVLHHNDCIQIGEYELAFLVEAEVGIQSSQSQMAEETALTLQTHLTSVLVIDIRDYTALAQRLGEARIAQLMGVFNRESGVALDLLGSWGQKYMGDAIMAVWVHQKGLSRLQFTLAIFEGIARIAEIVTTLQDRFDLDTPVRAGYGFSTGKASVGNVGGPIAADHTAMGDVVNRAFRLEASTRQLDCDIVLGDEIWEELASEIDVTGLATTHMVQLKGYAEQSLVYALQLETLNPLIVALRAHGVCLGVLDRSGDGKAARAGCP